jgi:hypothetical protein
MQDFHQWIESRNIIQIIAQDSYGKVTFLINGKKYVYQLEGYKTENGLFPNLKKKNAGRALNYAKKYGKQIYPITFKKDFQNTCPQCGAMQDSYQGGIAPCPNCDYEPQS